MTAPVDFPLDQQSPTRSSTSADIRPPGKLALLAGMAWLAILAAGFFVLAREEYTPVAGSTAGPVFPPHSALTLAPGVPTLILFAHPRCPCTRASLHELADLLVGLPRKIAVTVVFTLPKGVAPTGNKVSCGGKPWRSRMFVSSPIRTVGKRDASG